MPRQAGGIGATPRYLAIGTAIAAFSVATFAVWSVDDSGASFRQMGLIGAAAGGAFLAAFVYAVAYRVVARMRSLRIDFTNRGARSQRIAYGLGAVLGVASGGMALVSNSERMAVKIGLVAALIAVWEVAIWLLSPFVFERRA